MELIDWINLQGKRALRSLLRSSLSARCPSPLVLLRDCTADRSRSLTPPATCSCRGALHLIIVSIPSVGPNPLGWKLALEYMDIVPSWQYPVHDSSNGPYSDLSETLFASVCNKSNNIPVKLESLCRRRSFRHLRSDSGLFPSSHCVGTARAFLRVSAASGTCCYATIWSGNCAGP
jgi:hypothetical protein